jgi:hypothetical protein
MLTRKCIARNSRIKKGKSIGELGIFGDGGLRQEINNAYQKRRRYDAYQGHHAESVPNGFEKESAPLSRKVTSGGILYCYAYALLIGRFQAIELLELFHLLCYRRFLT